MVDALEAWIDKYDAETPDITRFILPGGNQASSALHICRTVCRRAERRVVTLARTQEINPEVRRYLNRLSDLFFTVARTANFREGVADVEYLRSAEVFRHKK
jgi:cob(I)alamin adenosyltransferase